jgi:Protein of unknown function (DUF4238)
MYAIRKTDLKAFTPNAQSVCRIESGSTNAYLEETRAIEDFLQTIEPNYNESVDKLIAGTVDRQSIYVIAGFIAYVMTCSPAGMRIFSGPLRSTIETTAAMMDARGKLPAPPPQVGGSSLTELIGRGIIKINIDPKYPQALGITAIVAHTAQFGNFHWELLRNERATRPFFTSDFPVAMEKTDDFRIFNRIVPLAPNLAVRAIPDITAARRGERPDFSFPNFRHQYRTPKHAEIVRINRLIVRCAERDGVLS